MYKKGAEVLILCWVIGVALIIFFTMIFSLILGALLGVDALAFIFSIHWTSVTTSNDLILVLFSCTFVAIICTSVTLFITPIIAFPLIKIAEIVFPSVIVEKDAG